MEEHLFKDYKHRLNAVDEDIRKLTLKYAEDFLYIVREKLHARFEITHTTLQVEKDYRDDAYRPFKKLKKNY